MTNSVIFNAWQSWSIDLPVTNDWKQVYAPAVYTSVTQYGYYNVAAVRDSCFGAVSCYNLTGNSGGPQGRLWIEMEVEFRDASPQAGIPVPLLMDPRERRPPTYRDLPEDKSESKEEKKVDRHESKEEKKMDDSDDEPEVISPPKFRPTPSHYVGSPDYSPSSTPKSRKDSKK
jgi:hypothetical protein